MKATTARLEDHAAPRTWKSLRLVPSTNTGDLSAGLSLIWGEFASALVPMRPTRPCYRVGIQVAESTGALERWHACVSDQRGRPSWIRLDKNRLPLWKSGHVLPIHGRARPRCPAHEFDQGQRRTRRFAHRTVLLAAPRASGRPSAL